jgi:hypothetical protein
MNLRSTLVNEYTVGGSLLLVGFGFFSTRFADILSYRVTTLPSMLPVIGGKTVTVGRILGVVPATLGLAVLFRKAREVPVVSDLESLPLVRTVVNYVDDVAEDVSSELVLRPKNLTIDLSAEDFDAEQALLCAEHDDYFSACGCEKALEEVASETEVKSAEVKGTSGSPKQQAWRACVRDAKGDMAEAKRMYKSMGY